MTRPHAVFFALLALILVTSSAPVRAQKSFTEDFTTRTAMDTAVTTADWDTTLAELRLFPFALSEIGVCATPGNAINVAVDGDYVYIADTPTGLLVVDITDPSLPEVIGTLPTPDGGNDLVVSGDLAFLANRLTGLLVIDISDPYAPALLGGVSTPEITWSVAVAGDLALFVDGPGGLHIVDVSVPDTPRIIAEYVTPDVAHDVVVAGDLALVADGSSLQIIDISEPSAPVFVASVPSPGFANDVEVAGNLAYVATGSAGLQVVDIRDPENPYQVGLCPLPLGHARDISIAGDLVYVSDTGLGLQVVDVTDPTNPVVVASYAPDDLTLGAVAAGELVFMAQHDAGLHVARINHLVRHTLAGNVGTDDFAMDIALAGNRAFVADRWAGLQVLDITDRSNLAVVAAFDTPGTATAVVVAGDFAFVADDTSGLRILDILDPEAPVLAAVYDTPGQAVGVFVAGDAAFVADGASGLQVVDITDPADPTYLGEHDTPDFAQGVTVAGDLAFVADGLSGLQIVDITNPAQPVHVGEVDTPGYAHNVTVAGDLAYVADRAGGLQFVSIANPEAPTLLDTQSTPGEALDVVVVGDYAFVATNNWSLLTYDVTFWDRPLLLGTFFGGAWGAGGLAAAGDLIYIADRYTGVQAVRVFQHEFDFDRYVGQSLPVAGVTDPVVRVRMTSTQAGGASWLISADSGGVWAVIEPDGGWVVPTFAGTELRWRVVLFPIEAGVNPAVSSVTLEWLDEYATIGAIADVPNDQGGKVDLTIMRSGYDFTDEAELPVTGYNVYRRVDGAVLEATSPALSPVLPGQPLRTPAGVEAWALPGADVVADGEACYVHNPAGAKSAASFPAGTWKLVATAFATQTDTYLVEATTAADSSAAGTGWSVYVVTTHTTTPTAWFTSQPDSGYSVDNIAPGVPTGISAEYRHTGVTLDWDDAPDADFQYYRVYRGAAPEFVPDETTLIGETAASAWTDPVPSPWDYSYKVTVIDHAGNESEPRSPTPPIAGTGQETPAATALLGATPNPFNPATKLAFDLAAAERARIEIFDLAGRRVAVVADADYPAGRHAVTWNGCDDAGRRLASGVYFYRLVAGRYEETRRLMLVK